MSANKETSLVYAAERLIATFDQDGDEWLVDMTFMVSELQNALEDQRLNEETVPVMLAGLREELVAIGKKEVMDLFDDLVASLEEVIDLPIAHKLETETLVKYEDCWEMVPKAPPGASA